MKRFYFRLDGPDGVEPDEDGILCADVEHAYLEACHALPDIAAEILRARKDPMHYSFRIESEDRTLLMTVPFDEMVVHLRKPAVAVLDTEAEDQRLRDGLREGAARVYRQREIVAKLHARGHDTTLANEVLATLERSHSMQSRFADQLLWWRRAA